MPRTSCVDQPKTDRPPRSRTCQHVVSLLFWGASGMAHSVTWGFSEHLLCAVGDTSAPGRPSLVIRACGRSSRIRIAIQADILGRGYGVFSLADLPAEME